MKDRLTRLERELGVAGLVGGFTGHHQPRSPQESSADWARFGIFRSVADLVDWSRGAAARRTWERDRSLPIGRVVVGVGDSTVMVGVGGHVHARWDLAGAFGRVCNLHEPTWVEVGGSRIWVAGPELDEALRLRGEVLAGQRHRSDPPAPGTRSDGRADT